ncbi:hypothetical protein WN943_003303 [Citrus x changshan-huyou]
MCVSSSIIHLFAPPVVHKWVIVLSSRNVPTGCRERLKKNYQCQNFVTPITTTAACCNHHNCPEFLAWIFV